MRSIPFLALIALLQCTPSETPSFDPVSYVDVFIGTAGDNGQLDPAATVPFGMVKLGPDTDPFNHSGYNYEAEKIRGFSHNRIGGVGCRGAGGNIRIKPGIGIPNANSEWYRKATEEGAPGYYNVTFQSGIQAEMTATNQVGFHRYTFPEADSAYFVIDPAATFEKLEVLDHKVISVNGNELTGFITAQNVCNQGAYTTYFVLYASENLENTWYEDDKLYWLLNTQRNQQVEFSVVLSPVSIAQAKKDFEVSYADYDFDKAREEAKELWSSLLSRIKVKGEEDQMTLFYTHLYRTLLTPVNTTTTDNTYKGTDGKIHRADRYTHYDSWSMWDTFRTKFPLITLLYPELAQDFVKSVEDLYINGKFDWAGFHEPVPTVRTEHTILFLLDAYRKGLKVNWERIYPYLVSEMDSLPYRSPDNWLESSYDKWAMSQIAGIVGNSKDAEKYGNESAQYRQVWADYFQHINDSSDIMHGYGLYEGTIWQYRWHVHFDIEGLIEQLGGRPQAIEQLSYFFDHHLYNHGNQPDIHAPYLFNAFGAPGLTQRWVTQILTGPMEQHYGTHHKWQSPYQGKIYKNDPRGYFPEMDDDDGTMSAWYVLSAMGLYPLEIGKPFYELTVPILDEIRMIFNDGKTFEIITDRNGHGKYTVESVTLNGTEKTDFRIHHSVISEGGLLKYKLK